MFKSFNNLTECLHLRGGKDVCYSLYCSASFHHMKPAAVIFILGFVIYRSERKLKNTAQSHRKWVSDQPLQLISTCVQTLSFVGSLCLSLSGSPRLSWVLNWQPFLHELIVHCLLQGFLWPQYYTKKRSPGEGQRAVGTQCLCLTGVLVLRAAWLFYMNLGAHNRNTASLMSCAHMNVVALPDRLTSVDFACYSALYFV